MWRLVQQQLQLSHCSCRRRYNVIRQVKSQRSAISIRLLRSEFSRCKVRLPKCYWMQSVSKCNKTLKGKMPQPVTITNSYNTPYSLLSYLDNTTAYLRGFVATFWSQEVRIMRGLLFSQRYCWKFKSFGTWCCVIKSVVPDASKDRRTFTYSWKRPKENIL